MAQETGRREVHDGPLQASAIATEQRIKPGGVSTSTRSTRRRASLYQETRRSCTIKGLGGTGAPALGCRRQLATASPFTATRTARWHPGVSADMPSATYISNDTPSVKAWTSLPAEIEPSRRREEGNWSKGRLYFPKPCVVALVAKRGLRCSAKSSQVTVAAARCNRRCFLCRWG